MDQKRDHDEDQQNPVGKDACYREHTEKKEKAKKQERPFFVREVFSIWIRMDPRSVPKRANKTRSAADSAVNGNISRRNSCSFRPVREYR